MAYVWGSGCLSSACGPKSPTSLRTKVGFFRLQVAARL